MTTVNQSLALLRRSRSSYTLQVGTLDDLGAYLEGLQFWREPGRSPHEYVRYRSGRGAMVVVYHTGTVLVQGQQPQQTHAQLRHFVAGEGVQL
jgi:hypothetical protein